MKKLMPRLIVTLLAAVLLLACLPGMGPVPSYTPEPTVTPAPSPAPAYEDVLVKIGDQSPLVELIQQRLSDLGFYNYKITDYYGALTETAVMQYQKAVGLTADGTVAPETMAKLFPNDAPRNLYKPRIPTPSPTPLSKTPARSPILTPAPASAPAATPKPRSLRTPAPTPTPKPTPAFRLHPGK